MKKIIKLVVEIETDKDFNLDELAVGKYSEKDDGTEQGLIISEGEVDKEKFFRVNDYLKVEDVTNKHKELKQQMIGLAFMNNRFLMDADFDEEYNKLTDDEKEEIEEELKQNM